MKTKNHFYFALAAEHFEWFTCTLQFIQTNLKK